MALVKIECSLPHNPLGLSFNSRLPHISSRVYGALFVTLNQKLGYSIEFTRKGYEKDSKMFILRKNL
jgi:hypothetical protein